MLGEKGSVQWAKHEEEGYKNGFSIYEHQYMDALRRIYEDGFSDGINERTKHDTKRLPGVVLQVDVEKQFPILKSKRVWWESAIQEILWIMQKMSNNIHDLKPHIWDKWADESGSIGSCYGYQVNRCVDIIVNGERRHYDNQVQFVLEYLREFPNGRWAMITLWNPQELYKMNLCPCCHTSTWNLDGGRLNCVLDQRSGDMPVGVPFNTTQYAALMYMFARDLGVKPGILTHVIADAHIYDNQMDLVKQQLAEYDMLKMGYSIKNGEKTEKTDGEFHRKNGFISGDLVRYSRPRLEICDSLNPLEDSGKRIPFADISFEGIHVIDYASNSSIPYPVTE